MIKFVAILTTLLFLLLPSGVYAQGTDGKCRKGEGFVNWQECLQYTPAPGQTTQIPGFFNNAYQTYFDTTAKDLCNISGALNFGTKTTIEECQSAMVLNKITLDVFTLLLGAMFLIFSFLVFRSRIMYITAGDNEDQVKKSKKIATAAFVGFLIVFIGIIVGQIFAISIGSNLWDIKLFG